MAKKAPFRFGRARCIFCERQPPDVKITKEHIFGDWLRGQFPRDATTTHTYGVINYPEPSKGFHNPTIRRKKQQGHSGSSKARVVCQLCNSGWLSNEIEERAKPILTAVMNSGVVSLTSEAQRMLAIWATKIVMVAEHIGPNDPLLTQSDRSHLKNTLTPPPGWHVYLGSYNGALFRELSIFQSVGELRVPAIDGGVPTPHNLEVTSLGIGEAVFLVVNSSWSELWPRYGPVLGSQGAGMVQIWPTSIEPIAWPLWTILDDDDGRLCSQFLARPLLVLSKCGFRGGKFVLACRDRGKRVVQLAQMAPRRGSMNARSVWIAAACPVSPAGSLSIAISLRGPRGACGEPRPGLLELSLEYQSVRQAGAAQPMRGFRFFSRRRRVLEREYRRRVAPSGVRKFAVWEQDRSGLGSKPTC